MKKTINFLKTGNGAIDHEEIKSFNDKNEYRKKDEESFDRFVQVTTWIFSTILVGLVITYIILARK